MACFLWLACYVYLGVSSACMSVRLCVRGVLVRNEREIKLQSSWRDKWIEDEKVRPG